METRSSAKVELVPWDYESAAHCDRIFQQREACGWKSEEVEMWRDKSRNGTKMLYWIILSDDCPGREGYLASHVTKYPEESTPIIDTAPAAYLQLRHPSGATFTPIGHVALDLRPEENSNVGLPSDAAAVWISALYVSWALQRGGVGGAAMRATEKLAGDENGPLKGELIVLDTVPEEYQFDEALIEQFYYAYGRPKPVISNEMWYRKQGYELFHSVPVGYMWPKNGEMVPVPFLYMKKKLR